MADHKDLSKTFNKSAPAYEPELWNNQVSKKQMADFIDRHRPVIMQILAADQVDKNLFDLSPETRADQAIKLFNSKVERLGSDERVADAFGLSVADVQKFKPEAKEIYLAEGFQKFSNCYSYAMNDRDRYSNNGDNPGERASGIPDAPNYRQLASETEKTHDYKKYKELLIKGVEADGAIIAGKDAGQMDGHYRVAVYAMPPQKMAKGDNGWTDMHFVRENQDGTWSHKPGSLDVTDKDASGKTITNPKTANLGGYEFLTYVYVPQGGLDVGFSFEPKTKPGSVDVLMNPEEDWKRRSNPYPEVSR